MSQSQSIESVGQVLGNYLARTGFSASPQVRARQIETSLGIEAMCTKCKEYWPYDSEFFYPHKGGLHAQCKACQESANKRARNVRKK